MIMSSRPWRRRSPLGTSRGSKLLSRSRGTSRPIGPICDCTVFGVVPFREFGEPRPAGSPRSYPRWPVCSASRPRSRTALTSSGRNPPSPVSCTPPDSARSINSSSQASSANCSRSCRPLTGPGGPQPDSSSSVTVTACSQLGQPPQARTTSSYTDHLTGPYDEGVSELVIQGPTPAVHAAANAIDQYAWLRRADGDTRPVGVLRAETGLDLLLR